jgi:hypothetical protein
MNSLAQPAWAHFLIKYTDVMITVGIVYFAFFFTLVAAAILFPASRTKRLPPGFRSDGHTASPIATSKALDAGRLEPASA